MRPKSVSRHARRRRGAIVVLAAFFLVVMVGMIAFALDIGYLGLAKTQLQVVADSAALAAAGSSNQTTDDTIAIAQQFADANHVAGRAAQLDASDVQFGAWDETTRVFTPSTGLATAVKVTVRTDSANGGATPLFFGRIFGVSSVNQQASAVATVNPRDIAFVVDLSGSMNDDTDPNEAATLNSQYAAQGYPTIGTDLMQQVYDDFGFGAYPGATQWIGQPLGVAKSGCLSTLTSITGPLSQSTIPVQYRILSTDTSSTRTHKAYSWAMDVQLPQVMPNVIPTPNSTNASSYSYWAAYFNDSHTSSQTKLGFSSYVSFMMYYGRALKPDGTNYTPLSRSSPYCPYHSESTAGGAFSFPPREMPTHSGRRALIAAIKLIKDRNQSVSDTNQRDWVSIITFDIGTSVARSLTNDYDAVMSTCATLQAVADNAACTNTEAGLTAAYNHIKPESQGGSGRPHANKIIVLMTDGQPNLKQSTTTAINDYKTANPSTWTNPATGSTSSNWFTSSTSYYQEKNAALMQTSTVQGDHWYLYPVGIGLGCDYDFMDRMARVGVTANNTGQSPRGTGNPAQYEAVLTKIFHDIITNPKLRLVQ